MVLDDCCIVCFRLKVLCLSSSWSTVSAWLTEMVI
ncbi:Uncharacterised protein [Mycobacteroides abscessus subsp. abscessus]|nr:Uncharacterised protein [Mycobacteroides abscessus subsp. abscessus]